MNKKGFTVVELITTVSLIAVISILLVKLTLTLKQIYIDGDMKTTLITKQSTMTDKIYKDLNENTLTSINACMNENEEVIENCMELVFESKTTKLTIDKNKKTITYDNYSIKLGNEGSFGDISIEKYNSDDGNILNIKVPINNKLTSGDYGINITYQLNNDINFDNNIVFDVTNTGVTVTFDPNGGTVSNTSKQVTVGENYGALPIPKRDGYTFKGWNGKNLFNLEDITIVKSKIETNGNNIIFDGSDTQDNTSTAIIVYKLNNDNIVTPYIKWQNFAITSVNATFTKDSSFDNIYIKENTSKNDPGFNPNNINLVNDKKYTISYKIDSYDSSHAKATISNFQLEEGDTATEYEPYYITSSTKVTQDKNHTLKAIWEENE